MKPRTEIFFGLWITTLCLANDPAPYSSQFARLDRIFALTTTRSQTGVAALELLELVAQGRTSAIRPGTETQVGLAPGELQQGWFTVPSVRVHALQRIGQSQLPEALDFLRTLGRGDLGEDASQMVWPAAQIALKNALLDRIPDSESKIEFLKRTITEKHDAISNSAVVSWAVDELCNRGTSTALPIIRQSVRYRISGPSGEDEIEFCEARIQVVSRDPDRVKALGSAPTMDNSSSDRLIRWAADQLNSMHSQQADAELDRFANELRKLREGSPQYSRFWQIREEVHGIQDKRAK